MAHYEMGIALFETGDLKTAAGHFEIVVSKMPKFADAHFSLASVYARIEPRPGGGARAGRGPGPGSRALPGEPAPGPHPVPAGQAAAAAPHLEKAAASPAASAEAHRFLADAYDQLGRRDDAARERERARAAPAPRSP